MYQRPNEGPHSRACGTSGFVVFASQRVVTGPSSGVHVVQGEKECARGESSLELAERPDTVNPVKMHNVRPWGGGKRRCRDRVTSHTKRSTMREGSKEEVINSGGNSVDRKREGRPREV